MKIQKAALWLLVLNLGIAFGAGLYEARIVFPQWLVLSAEGYVWNPEAARTSNVGMRFWVFVSTLPLTLLLLVNLAAAWKSQAPLRKWWLTTLAILLLERALTFSFFIPTMIRLMEVTPVLPNAEAVAQALLWEKMNCLRHLLNFAAWICALKSFALFYQQKR